MSQGTTAGGAFRYPYEHTAIFGEFRQALRRAGVDHDSMDQWNALIMDRDRALEDYLTVAAETTPLPFIVVDSTGEGDYTSIKEAIEDLPAATTNEGIPVIYVKPGSYDDGTATCTIPSGARFVLWAAQDWTDLGGPALLPSVQLNPVKWTIGNIVFADAGTFVIHGIYIQGNTTVFNGSSGGSGQYVLASACRFSSGGSVYNNSSTVQDHSTVNFYLNNCVVSVDFLGSSQTTAAGPAPNMFCRNTSFLSGIVPSSSTTLTCNSRGLMWEFEDCSLGGTQTLTINGPTTTSALQLKFVGCTWGQTSVMTFNRPWSFIMDNCMDVVTNDLESNAGLTLTVLIDGTWWSSLDASSPGVRMADNRLPFSTVALTGTIQAEGVDWNPFMSGSYRRVSSSWHNMRMDLHLAPRATSSTTSLTITGHKHLITAAFEHSGSSNTAINVSGNNNVFWTTGRDSYSTPLTNTGTGNHVDDFGAASPSLGGGDIATLYWMTVNP